MALVFADLVKETTSTTGTGTLTLTGAVTNFQSFAAIGNANTTYYRLISGIASEVGIGTYTSAGTTLSRDTVLYSTAGGTTKITVAAGATVICTYPAEKIVILDASGNATGLGTPAAFVATNVTGLPLSTGVTGTLPVANGGTGVTTSTGTGNTVLSTSPTLVTPILGTPASGTLTSCTGLPLTTGVTGTLPVANGGTGVTTSTGTGSTVLSASPTFTGTVNTANLAYTGTLTGGTGVVDIGTNQIVKDASGNVGIGNTTPSTFDQTGKPLVVGSGSGNQGITIYAGATGYSSVNFADGTTGSARYAGQVSYDHTNNALLFATNTGTDRMTLGSSGIVTMNAYGAGAATFSASGVISSVSDETWKIKDGIPVNPDEMIQKLKPGYWFYNAEKAPIFGTDRQLGFYAQNVNAAIGPEAAPPPEEGKPWGYYDRSVLAVAVMSLQKALTTIESLTERLTALENK
jgi:hypothetical protein